MGVSPVGTTAKEVVAGMLAEGGLRQFWRGYLWYMMVWGPFSATYFAVYEMTRSAWTTTFSAGKHRTGLESYSLSGSAHAPWAAVELGSGAVAGVAAALVSQPLDC